MRILVLVQSRLGLIAEQFAKVKKSSHDFMVRLFPAAYFKHQSYASNESVTI